MAKTRESLNLHMLETVALTTGEKAGYQAPTIPRVNTDNKPL